MRKRLSRHHRLLLYRERPDLDMSRPLADLNQEGDQDDENRLLSANGSADGMPAPNRPDALMRAEMEAQEFGIAFDQQSPPSETNPDLKSSLLDVSGGGLLSPLLDEEHGISSFQGGEGEEGGEDGNIREEGGNHGESANDAAAGLSTAIAVDP